MGNQRGEVVIAVMVVVMAAMMIFGGMHLMSGGHGSGEHGSGGHCMQHGQKHDDHIEGIRHTHNSEELAAVSADEEGK